MAGSCRAVAHPSPRCTHPIDLGSQGAGGGKVEAEGEQARDHLGGCTGHECMSFTSGARVELPAAPIVHTLLRKLTDQVHKARQHCGARLPLQ